MTSGLSSLRDGEGPRWLGEKTAGDEDAVGGGAMTGPTSQLSAVHGARLIDEASVSAPAFVPAVFKDAAALVDAGKSTGEAIASLEASSCVSGGRSRRAFAPGIGGHAHESGDRGARSHWRRRHEPSPTSGMSHWRLGRLQLPLGDEASRPSLVSDGGGAAILGGGGARLRIRSARILHNQLDLDRARRLRIRAESI